MFKGISSKITIALFSLASAMAVTVGISFSTLSELSDRITEVRNVQVPNIENATYLLLSASELKSSLTSITGARSTAELGDAKKLVQEVILRTSEKFGALDPETREQAALELSNVEKILQQLTQAKESDLKAAETVRENLSRLETLRIEISNATTTLVDDTYLELISQGEGALEGVADTLDNLVNELFPKLSNAQQIRAEINLLVGVSMALSETENSGLIAILEDLGLAASNRLHNNLKQLENSEFSPIDTSVFADASTLFNFNKSYRFYWAQKRDQILSFRQSTDAYISILIDDLEFDLAIESDDAATSNAETINGLMDGEVSRILTAMAFDAAVKELVANALTAATANDLELLKIAAENLSLSQSKLSSIDLENPGLKQLLEEVLNLTDLDEGVVAFRSAELSADEKAVAITDEAVKNINSISNLTGSVALTALEDISVIGDSLASLGQASQTRMLMISFAAFIIVLGSLFALRMTVVKPLVSLTNTTERLAEGDMTPISVPRATGEIAQMESALQVFRENALKVEDLRQENATQQQNTENARREMLVLLSREIGTVVDGAAAGDFGLRVTCSFNDQELSRLADGINHLMNETERGLGAITKILRAVADTDLTAKFPEGFHGVFHAVGSDLNQTTQRLADIIQNIRETAKVSYGSVQDISEGAEKLAERAELQAVTLEESNAAMEILTESIKSNAMTLTKAEELSKSVSSFTKQGTLTAREAVSNVHKISDVSLKINEINQKIESIAFQTNLLALNAAVEAARAGDAGKGFAVVAAEVRELAKLASQAAKEISVLVKQNVVSVESGIKSVEETNDALEKIEQSISPVLDALANIASQGREQSDRISLLNESIGDLDHVTQQNAKQASNSFTHVRQLESQIATLDKQAAIFNVTEELFEDATGFVAKIAI